MRQGWLALITLTIAGSIAVGEILHQTHEASRGDIQDFLKNIPPEIDFKYKKVSPALTIRGMDISDASFHLGTTKFFFKRLRLGHPHIEENTLKFSSVMLDHARIISQAHIFSSKKAILRHFEIIPTASKHKKWNEIVFDENTFEENEGFTPTQPENKKIVTSFFEHFSHQTPTLGNIRFARVQFEKVKIEKRFQTTLPPARVRNTLAPAPNATFLPLFAPRAEEIRSLVAKDGFLTPSLSFDSINVEGYGVAAHPMASFKNFQIESFYKLLHPAFSASQDQVRKFTLSIEKGEIHEGGNLLQRSGHEEIIAARQFWDDPTKFLNTAPYGFTLSDFHGQVDSQTGAPEKFFIPKISGERRLSAVNDRWAFKSYFDIAGFKTNLGKWPALPEEITASLPTDGPSLAILSYSVPVPATKDYPESWTSKLSLSLTVDKQSRIKGSIALRYPPLSKEFFEQTSSRLQWEDLLRLSNLSLTFSGRNLPTILCASWQAFKEPKALSCNQFHEILHDHAAERPDLENILEWMADPQKHMLQASFTLDHFWQWNSLEPHEALGKLPIVRAQLKPL